jgi:hypothetical protein
MANSITATVSTAALCEQLKSLEKELSVVDSDLVTLLKRDYVEFVKIAEDLQGVDHTINEARNPMKKLESTGKNMLGIIQQHKVVLGSVIQDKMEKKKRLQFIKSCVTVLQLAQKAENILNRRYENKDLTKELSNLRYVAKAIKAERAAFAGLEKDSIPVAVLNAHRKAKNVCSTLLRRLDVIYGTEIGADDFYSRMGKINSSVLASCTGTYFTLGQVGLDSLAIILNQILVSPYIEDIITEGRLDGGERGSCKGLATLLKCLSDFIKDRCYPILVVAYDPAVTDCKSGYITDLFCAGVWVPIIDGVIKRLGSIFSPGIAGRCHSNYTAWRQFLCDVDAVIVWSSASKSSFRSHPSTRLLNSKWSLPIYFQLRRKEALKALEDSIKNVSLEFKLLDSFRAPFSLPWKSDVFLNSLVSELFALSMQMVGVVTDWAAIGVETFLNSKRRPVESEAGHAFWQSVGISNFFSFFVNWGVFTKWFTTDLLQNILATVKTKQSEEPFSSSAKNDLTFARKSEIISEAFGEAASHLEGLQEQCKEILSTRLIEDCSTNLILLKSVIKAYRFQKNKPLPSAPSPYVMKFGKPLEEILKHENISALSDKVVFFEGISASIIMKFDKMATQCIEGVQKSDASLKSIKRGKVGGTTLNSPGASDLEKIELQFKLDRGALQTEIHRLLHL